MYSARTLCIWVTLPIKIVMMDKKLKVMCLILALASAPSMACDNCNAADTVSNNIIRAMKARSATNEKNEKVKDQANTESKLDENFFSGSQREEAPPSYRRPRAVVEQY